MMGFFHRQKPGEDSAGNDNSPLTEINGTVWEQSAKSAESAY